MTKTATNIQAALDAICQQVKRQAPRPAARMYTSPNVNPFTGRLIDPIAEAKRVANGGAK